jgi:hypothetical protein
LVVLLKGKGRRDEMAVKLSIERSLDSGIYTAIHDVTIHTPAGITQIDHIVVSKFGIFVIETKNMDGWIFGGPNTAEWTQSFPGGKKYRFQNPLLQNYKHTKSLAEFLVIDHALIHSIIIFVGNATFKSRMPENVLSSGLIEYIQNKAAYLFTEKEISKMVEMIRIGMMSKTAKMRRKHIETIANRHRKK